MDDHKPNEIRLGTEQGTPTFNRRRSSGVFQTFATPVVAVLALIIALVSLLSGSGGKLDPSVAIIDLDKVAIELGKASEIDRVIETEAEAIAEGLKQLAAEYKGNIDQKQAGLPPILDLQTQSKLNAEADQLGRDLQIKRDAAAADLKRKRIELLSAFRDEVKPHAEAVAKENGYSVVFTDNSTVVYSVVSPTADITDKVIKVMKSREGEPASVASNPQMEKESIE